MEIFKGMSIITISLLCDTDKDRSGVKFKKSQETTMTIDEHSFSFFLSSCYTMLGWCSPQLSIEKFDKTENHLSGASVSDSN